MSRLLMSTFTAAKLHEVWCVTRNGVFYGDYNSREQAVAGAKAGARAAENRGGAACVLIQPGSQVVPH